MKVDLMIIPHYEYTIQLLVMAHLLLVDSPLDVFPITNCDEANICFLISLLCWFRSLQVHFQFENCGYTFKPFDFQWEHVLIHQK